MIDPDKRPPLSVTVQEQIESEQKALHDKYWPQILELTVPVNFFTGVSGNRSSPPIRQQRKLFRILESYATTLFDTEARHYPLHHNNMEQWLLALGQETFNIIIARLSFSDLNYHASDAEIKVTIMEAIRVRTNAYLSSVLGPVPLEPLAESGAQKVQEIVPTAKKEATTKAQKLMPEATKENRKALRDAYLSRFPEAFIVDICWAAKQHQREWRRWIRGEAKDGSRPDRCFRAVLSSKKRPGDYRTEARPKDWK